MPTVAAPCVYPVAFVCFRLFSKQQYKSNSTQRGAQLTCSSGSSYHCCVRAVTPQREVLFLNFNSVAGEGFMHTSGLSLMMYHVWAVHTVQHRLPMGMATANNMKIRRYSGNLVKSAPAIKHDQHASMCCAPLLCAGLGQLSHLSSDYVAAVQAIDSLAALTKPAATVPFKPDSPMGTNPPGMVS